MPSFFGGFGVNEALGLGGGLANAITGRSAAKSQKEMMRRQAQGAELSNQLFRQTTPMYQDLLQQYAQRAGMQVAPGLLQTGPGSYQVADDRNQYGLGGQYGDQTDQLRLRQAEEEINNYYRNQANNLRHQMGEGGVGLNASLARLASQQGQQYAGFRRNLAINAGQEQERRLGALQGALGFGLGQGGAANAVYGQQAAQYGQQAAGANQGLANIISQYQYQKSLQGLAGQGGGQGSTLDPYTYSADTYSPFEPGPYDAYDPYGMRTPPRRAALGR